MEIPEIFVRLEVSKNSDFALVSFSQLVYRFEDLTASDPEFQLIGRRISREHDAVYNALRNGDESEARRQFSLQHQELLDCREKFD
jgi:hypothetical protein